MWRDGSVLHVLLTECDRRQAEVFLKHARAHMPQLLPASSVRVAVFPEDGVTVGALLEAIRPAENERAPAGLAS